MTQFATITEYCNGSRRWWGLKDGTILELDDPKGALWFQWENEEPKEITLRSFV